MAQQKGLLAFFKRSPAVDKNKPTSEKSQTTPSRNPASSKKRTNEELADDNDDIGFVKSKKRRRVLIDSDDEEDADDGASSPIHHDESAGNEKENEGMELMEGVANGEQQEKGLDKMVSADKSSMSDKDRGAVDNGGTDSDRGLVSGVLATPPKRRTARKHTGKVWSTPLHESGSNGAVQEIHSKPIPAAITTNTTTAAGGATDNDDDDDNARANTKKEEEVEEEVVVKKLKVEEETKEKCETKEEDVCSSTEDDVPSIKKDSSKCDDEVDNMPSSETSDSTAAKTTPTSSKMEKMKTTAKDAKKPTSVRTSDVATSKATPTSSKPASKKEAKKKTTAKDDSKSPAAVKEEKKKGEGKDMFNPAQPDYNPLEDATWEKGQKVPYLALARTFELIEEESKRLKIIATLTNFFRSVLLLSPDEMVQCVYLCLNKLAPAYEGLELGIGESILVKAIAEATGRSVKQIKNDAVAKGDLGIVAEASRSTQRMMFAPPRLTVSAVFTKLKAIAGMTGNASMAKKVNIIKGLFTACRHSEARYLIRSLGGKLRIGLAEQSVLVAIGHAAVRTPPGQEWPAEVLDASKDCSSETFQKQLEEAALTIKTCYCEHPNYEVLLPALISHGISSLHHHCHLTPGIPLKPMLAHPTKGIQEVLQRFESADFTCEWKYDGERAQIHVLEGGEIRVYSRNSENNTTKYPDIIARMPKVLKDCVTSCVIDSEAVAWDVEKQQILPFQVLSTRKRKDADMAEIKVQVCVYAFDLLFYNGESLVKESFKTRREILRQSFNEIEGEFKIATSMDTTSVEEIQEFLEESIKGNCEGLMVKTLEKNATYEIARRSHNWLKLKKDYLEGVGDTLDLVVVGGFHGTGKRTGRYGGFLLACYDEENEEYQVICKIGTGFKDEDLETHAKFFKDHTLEGPKTYYRYSDGIRPDHWFEPVQVWEVKAADLSISPVYPAAAGIVDPEKGISLRFPRFLRIRDDKKPEDATSSQQVASLYRRQQNVNKASGEGADPEDFY